MPQLSSPMSPGSEQGEHSGTPLDGSATWCIRWNISPPSLMSDGLWMNAGELRQSLVGDFTQQIKQAGSPTEVAWVRRQTLDVGAQILSLMAS